MEDSEDYAAECFRAGVIAIGWGRAGDLTRFSSKDELSLKLARVYDGNPRELAQWTSMLWEFRTTLSKDDIVFCPDRDSKRVYVGKITGKYVHDKSPLGGCPFPHRRRVRWLCTLNEKRIRGTWPPDGRYGSYRTLSRIELEDTLLQQILKAPMQRTFPKRPRGLPIHPDKEWGRAAEKIAMKWLRARRKKPVDVSDRNLGCEALPSSWTIQPLD
jgi:hypothetical protein